MSNIKLSILIPVHINHELLFGILYDDLRRQIEEENATEIVEILYHIDNGEITTGAKRNGLLDRAKGDYIVFIDSDDSIPGYYVKEFLKASESNADCFGINGIMTTDGYNEIGWELSKDHPNLTVQRNGKPFYLRQLNHISCCKRGLALMARFPDKKLGEDGDYARRLNPFLKTEYKIIPPMYHYRYTSKNKLY